MGKSIKLYQDVSRRDILYPMRGALAVALALTLWSCVPGYGGKYPLVEKYNWERKIDGQGENNPPLQKGREPLIARSSGGMVIDSDVLEDKQIDEWKGISPEDVEAASLLDISNNDYLIDGFSPLDSEPVPEVKLNMNREISPHSLWPNGVVHYKLRKVFMENEKHRTMITKGLLHIQEKTCIKFVEKVDGDGVSNWIDVINGTGCGSRVGQGSGRQELSLSIPGCVTPGLTVHEFMHALGFKHEHTRPDRDEKVTINWENILEDSKHNFEIDPNRSYTLDQPYDLYSIMHYSLTAASKNGRQTITPKENVPNKGECKKIGQTCGMSDTDAKQINLLYNCDGSLDECRDIQPKQWCQDNINRCKDRGFPAFQKYCRESCGCSSGSCLTVGGRKVNARCVFPFSFRGRTYNGCTTISLKKLWCSTRTDSNGKHIRGHWGYCNSACQTDQGLQNQGAQCWRQCGERSGYCESFCGTDGLCCRRGVNWIENGCNGQLGIDDHHTCVAKPQGSCS